MKSNTKGQRKRVKGFLETTKQPRQKKTKVMIAQTEGQDFGTTTPRPKPTLI